MNKKVQVIPIVVLFVIVLGCIFADAFIPLDPHFMDLSQISTPPGLKHLFGTDTLGRDIFSMIWYGGRISLFIGIFSTLISTLIAVTYGCIAGLADEKADDMLMRLSDIFMSIPQVLMVVFIQAIFGEANIISISIVIALTGWMEVAKIVRSEVRQIKNSDYVLAAKTMGGGFFYILWNHLGPNFISAIMFIVISKIAGAIAMEATLSFLGIGLSVDVVSWGTLISLSQKAMLSGNWWILFIPGFFLTVTIICITELGEFIKGRKKNEILL